MKIVHVAPKAPYNDYWGYQDNLLPKYQSKDGHDVVMIITNTMHSDGKIVETQCGEYDLDDGVHVIRMEHKKYKNRIIQGLKSKFEIFDILVRKKPDLIFFHGLESDTVYDAIKYKKKVNGKVVIVADNHLDYYNQAKVNNKLKAFIIRAYYRFVNKRVNKHYAKVYGVTPWRKQFVEEYFKIPSKKTDVLIMGADDEKIPFAKREEIRKKIRAELAVQDDEFLIVSGGKIDSGKRIIELIKACDNDVKLLLFGNVSNDVKEDFDRLLQEKRNIIYIGWLNADAVYDYYFAADLAFFPGTHSVLWEQACAAKLPAVFLKWVGMDHVDNGGNADFIENSSVETIKNKIKELKFTEKYYKMKAVANSDKTDIYLYSKIAKKSIECVLDKDNGKRKL